MSQASARPFALLDCLMDATIVVDPAGCIQHLNPAATKLIGESMEACRGEPADQFFTLSHTSVDGGHIDILERAMQARAPSLAPVGTLLSGHGMAPALVDCSLSPLGGDGRFGGLLLVVRPLSGFQRRALAVVNSTEGKWRAFADHSGSAIYLKDLAGAFLYVNRAFCSIFKVSPESALGASDFELLPPTVAELLRRRDQRATRAPAPETTEDEVTLAGKGRVFASTRFLIPDEQGVASAVCCISTEVTAFREMEKRLRSHQQELAHVARLSMAGEMASGFAHELNQPLGAALSLTEAATVRLEDGDLPEVHGILKGAEAQIVRAGEIIKRLRRFVKQGDSELVSVDLNGVLERAVYFTRHDIESEGIALSVVPSPAPLVVQADPIQLEQVAVNFIRNAIEALRTEDLGNRRMEIATARVGAWGQLSVSDSGPGLPSTVLERAFEPFFTTRTNGMGLGLKISKTIIEGVGGVITIENNPTRGAKSLFRLPLHRA